MDSGGSEEKRPISTLFLSKLLDNPEFQDFWYYELVKKENFEMFPGHARLVQFAIDIDEELISDDQVIYLLKNLEDSALNCLSNGREGYKKLSKILMLYLQEARGLFAVAIPKRQMSNGTTYDPDDTVSIFIDFLLEILYEILHSEPDFVVSVKGSIEFLRNKLCFLITFLGDTLWLQPSDVNLLKDMETLLNKVGSFLYSFFFVRDRVLAPRMDLELSVLVQNLELVEAKIKEHCLAVPNMLGCTTRKIDVVSLFIVDSLLDDLKDLLNHKADKIVGVKDQFATLYEKLMLLRSSLTDKALQQQTELQELVIRTANIAYEIEYVINSFPPVWYLTVRLPQFLDKIELVSMSIEELKNNIGAGIEEVDNHPTEQVLLQPKGSVIIEDIVVGRDKKATEIAEQLIGGPERLEIISIFGMPGVGKTTLAKKLFNDPCVVYHFDKRAWCIISQTYSRRNIFIEILRSVKDHNKETIMQMDDESLVEALHKSLIKRRYLIVMDDIWDINAWHDFERYFPDDNNGSRILFTTRNKEVGLKASYHGVVNELSMLSDVESWELLQRKVFQKEYCPKELLDIGKQIARNCHGLPLAVVVIAAVLDKMEMKERLWHKVARGLSSHISEDPNKFMNILELSYKQLPMHLKPCFLYFGKFEEKNISVKELISEWVGEGFIKKGEGKSSEDVAYEYLLDLIDRSLVQVAKRTSLHGVKTCNVHDLLRDMCLRIGKQQNFLKEFTDSSSIYDQQHYPTTIIYQRSFAPSVGCLSRLSMCSFRLLRVLDLSGEYLGHYEQNRIEQLIHLRYLAVPCISRSIEKLHKLEFLYVDNAEEVQIPDFLLNMVNLRHMLFKTLSQFGKSCIRRATKDGSFPINNLKSISFLFISNEMDKKVLSCSPNLCKLKCSLRRFWDLSFLEQLESLNLSVHRDYERHLISFPLNLRKLTLRSFYMSRKQMKIIGRLPNLAVLKLREGSFEGEQWNTTDGEFQQLKFLELLSVLNIDWNASSNHFPKLERLLLRRCRYLKRIPSSFGDIPTLVMIEVHNCKQSVIESAMQIQEEQRDMGNEELQVIISGRSRP